ncbi:MAG: response regulator [Sulfurimonas sp.]|jgi:CheY-like chemotaxis protein
MAERQTILIVDDIEQNLDTLINLLDAYNLLIASNEENAINMLFDNRDIDLILLNIRMLKSDGYEICKALKKSPKTYHIPIIFLNSSSDQECIKKGFDAGGVDYISQPFHPDELLSRVSTHLRLRAYEKNLEHKVQEEIKKNKKKEQMMYQQSKQAALGELLMHISYQWKQPLASLLSINNKNRQRILSLDSFDTEEFLKSLKKSEDIVEFMAETIDTFQDFYKPSLDNKNFSLTDTILEILTIVEGTFYFDDIKIYIISHEKERSFGNQNEFSQVIFTILNNAREIFKLRDTIKPEIHIAIEDKRVTIRDNSGGIKEENFDNIFNYNDGISDELYLGLYMSKILVEKNGGVITAANSKDGASFTIEFLTWIE